MVTKYKSMRSFKKFLVVTFLIAISAFNLLMAQQLVHFSGSSDGKKEKYISIYRPPFFLKELKRSAVSEQIVKDGEFDFSISINKPEILMISAYYKNWYVQFDPGDSVRFNITGITFDKKITFFGKKEARYNLDVLVSDRIYGRRPYDSNLWPHKFKADEWRKTSLDAVDTYLSKHNVDRRSINLAKKKIDYHYAQLIYSYSGNVRKAFRSPTYYKDANKIIVNKDAYLSLIEYRTAIKEKFINNEKGNTLSALKTSYEMIFKNLRKETRDFALTLLAAHYAFMQSTKDSSTINKLYDELLAKKTLNATNAGYLKDNKLWQVVIGKLLPEHILDKTMLTSFDNDKPVSLAELLEGYKGKAVYIDLWNNSYYLSRRDTAKSFNAKQALLKNDVAYLYLSFHYDKKTWREAAEKYQITDHQFHFESDQDQALKALLRSGLGQRYILLDRNHKVKSLNAPMPTFQYEKEFNKMLADLTSQTTE